MTLADLMRRLPVQSYHLERVAAASVDDGLYWMRDWIGADGQIPWGHAGDGPRRHAVKHWFWLRWQHRSVIEQRGGQP